MLSSTLKSDWFGQMAPIEILGIIVDYSKQNVLQLNIDPILDKAASVLKLWKCRDLSLFGKILLINSLAASLFVYRLAIIEPLPKDYIRKKNN